MQAHVHIRYQPYSPRKVAQVLDLIRGKKVVDAFRILKFTKKAAARLVEKSLRSAVANANRLSNPEGLKIISCYVTKGPVLKRYQPMAFGRAGMIRKRTSHLNITISD